MSEFSETIDALPEWFKNILELIKEAHMDHVRELDSESDLDLDKLINETKAQFEPRIKAAKVCHDVISYVLHDEYQDMAYYPKISGSTVFDTDTSFAVYLLWNLEGGDHLHMRVEYYYPSDLGITVAFYYETRNKLVSISSGLTEMSAKNVRMPKWFASVLDKVKSSTFGDNTN
jgi:hypothetical protein